MGSSVPFKAIFRGDVQRLLCSVVAKCPWWRPLSDESDAPRALSVDTRIDLIGNRFVDMLEKIGLTEWAVFTMLDRALVYFGCYLAFIQVTQHRQPRDVEKGCSELLNGLEELLHNIGEYGESMIASHHGRVLC